MANPKKLLIAIDGSPHSRDAVSYVARHFVQAKLEVNLMNVMPTAPETFWDLERDAFFKRKMEEKYAEWKRSERKAAQRFLNEARNLLIKARFKEDDVGVILNEREVGIARDIIAEGSRGYDAVVVGRRGLSSMQDLYLGSVSNKIVEGTKDTPVWVVGGDIHSNKMLLAVDGSEYSRKAVNYVSSIAADTKGELTLFHVVRSVGLAFVDDLVLRDEETEKRLKEETERYIPGMFRSYKDSLDEAGVTPARISTKASMESHTRAGDILKEGKEGTYGTIVMGRKGLSRVREFLMGRVTKKVLDRAEGFAVWIVP